MSHENEPIMAIVFQDLVMAPLNPHPSLSTEEIMFPVPPPSPRFGDIHYLTNATTSYEPRALMTTGYVEFERVFRAAMRG